MRFVSKYKRYTVIFQGEIVEHFATGESREIRPYIACEFDLYGSMTAHEIDVARKTFENRGLPVEVDMITLIDPLTRFSVFDTVLCQERKGFDDAKREEMEAFLLGRPEHGSDFIVVEPLKLKPPWPTYDDFRGVRGLPTPQAIARKVEEDGYDALEVVAYERENAARSDVIAALEAIGSTPVVEEDLVEA